MPTMPTPRYIGESQTRRQQAHVALYLEQAVSYYSESGEEMLIISKMPPAHARNAARRLLVDAHTWAQDAGQSFVQELDAQLWMTQRPLFQALVHRAGIV